MGSFKASPFASSSLVAALVVAVDLATADLLIRAGANVNVANDLRITPLSLACINGSPPLTNLQVMLLDKVGVEVEKPGDSTGRFKELSEIG